MLPKFKIILFLFILLYNGTNYNLVYGDDLLPSRNTATSQSLPQTLLNETIAIIRFIVNDASLSIVENKSVLFEIVPADPPVYLSLSFNLSKSGIISNIPPLHVNLSKVSNYSLYLVPQNIGRTILSINSSLSNMLNATQAFLRVSVYDSEILVIVSDIIGWVYFLAWSVSFYPQIILNCRRKSVIGLHFDFLSLNFVGFLVYSIFNVGFYFVKEVQIEYFRRHPYGVNPVQLNDVVFSLHALFACMILILQCLVYERGNQVISRTGRSFLSSFIIASVIFFVLSLCSIVAWINFLYFLSYIKLFITLVKYIPQAYFNYIRKSTFGWSIGNIILDFTGGLLSIIQMFLIAYNFNDWSSIMGDPTKFGLGLVSIMFDVFFMVQHYVLYKSNINYFPANSDVVPTENAPLNQDEAEGSYGAI